MFWRASIERGHVDTEAQAGFPHFAAIGVGSDRRGRADRVAVDARQEDAHVCRQSARINLPPPSHCCRDASPIATMSENSRSSRGTSQRPQGPMRDVEYANSGPWRHYAVFRPLLHPETGLASTRPPEKLLQEPVALTCCRIRIFRMRVQFDCHHPLVPNLAQRIAKSRPVHRSLAGNHVIVLPAGGCPPHASSMFCPSGA